MGFHVTILPSDEDDAHAFDIFQKRSLLQPANKTAAHNPSDYGSLFIQRAKTLFFHVSNGYGLVIMHTM